MPTLDKSYAQTGQDNFEAAVNAWLARTQGQGATGGLPAGLGGRGAGVPATITPTEFQPDPRPGPPATAPSQTPLADAFREQSIAGAAEFLKQPWANNLAKMFGAQPAAPEAYGPVQEEAQAASNQAVQQSGKDWSLGRAAGHLAQLGGSVATPGGIAGTAAAAVTGGAALPALEALGASAVPAIVGSEVAGNLAFGAANRGVQGEDTTLQSIGWDAAAGLGFGALRGGAHLFSHAGEAGFTHWSNHVAEGESPYTVHTPVRNADGTLGEAMTERSVGGSEQTTPVFTVGKSGFDPINHPSAWEPIIKGAGLNAAEITEIRSGDIAGGTAAAKVNAFLATPAGKAVVDNLDKGYLQSVWLGAQDALAKAGATPDPHMIAQFADAVHEAGPGAKLDPRLMRDAKGRITANSIADWRVKAGQTDNASALAKRFTQTLGERMNPWTKNSTTANKGITVADADAALAASKRAQAFGPEIDPRVNPTAAKILADYDSRIAKIQASDPDAAIALINERRGWAERWNAEAAQQAEHAAQEAEVTAARDTTLNQADRARTKAEWDSKVQQDQAFSTQRATHQADFEAKKAAIDVQDKVDLSRINEIHKRVAELDKLGDSLRGDPHPAAQAEHSKSLAEAAKLGEERSRLQRAMAERQASHAADTEAFHSERRAQDAAQAREANARDVANADQAERDAVQARKDLETAQQTLEDARQAQNSEALRVALENYKIAASAAMDKATAAESARQAAMPKAAENAKAKALAANDAGSKTPLPTSEAELVQPKPGEAPMPTAEGRTLPSADHVADLMPDFPRELIAPMMDKVQTIGKGAAPEGLNDALLAHFNAIGGAEKNGAFIKWKNIQEQRVWNAMEAAHAPEPIQAMAESEQRLARQATAPTTRAEKIDYATGNVSVYGQSIPWSDFVGSDHAKLLTSEEFVGHVAHRANLAPGARATLQAAADAAQLDAPTFQTYLQTLERLSGPDVSFSLNPEDFAITRRISNMLRDLGPAIAEANGAPLPYTNAEAMTRALSRYFAQELHFDRATPETLRFLAQKLEAYERSYAAGLLTPEQHGQMMRAFAELIDGVTIHEGLSDGSHGAFNLESNATSLNMNSMLDTAVHEFMHGWTLATAEGQAFMREAADLLTPDLRAQLARLTDAHTDAGYAMSTEESVARLLQAYMADPLALSRYAPEAAELVEKAFAAMPPEQWQLFNYFAAVQKATASIHQRGDYQYPWLASGYSGAAARPFDYAASFSITAPSEWAGAFEIATKDFADQWLHDRDYLLPHQTAAYEFLQDVFDARSLGAAEARGTTFLRKAMPDPNLNMAGSADAASADTSLRHLASAEAGRSLDRAKAWFGSWRRVMPVESRAQAIRETNGIVEHVEPHMDQGHILTNEYAQSLVAAENKMISGRGGLLQQDFVKDFTRGIVGNVREALRSVVTGVVRLANPELNASLSRLAQASWERGAWMTNAEIDAAGLPAAAAKAFKYITAQTIERSNALKQSFIETFLAGESDLAKLTGKGLDSAALKASGKLNENQLRDLGAIDAVFRPGYYPTTRQGVFRVFALNAKGEAIFARGAHTKAEADQIAAALAGRFPDAKITQSRMPEVVPLANQLDATGSVVSSMLHYLRETEHGAELTVEDFQEVLRKMKEPGALRAYFAKRSGVPGWEEEDFLGRHAEFLRKSALFEHGQTFKRGIKELMLSGGKDGDALKGLAAEDITNLFNNTMNNRSKAEEALVAFANTVAPNAGHLRGYSQLIRQLAYAKVLGFSTLKRVALDANHALTVSLNELSAESGALMKAYGEKGGVAYATRTGALGVRDAATWLAGQDHDNPIFIAFEKAVAEGYMKASPVAGKEFGAFLRERKIGTPGQAALNKVLEVADTLGHQSTALREMATFSAFYRAYRELAPGMHEDAIRVFAGEKTMNTLNLRASNRPTLQGMQGEVANQVLTFKAFLGNVLAKTMQNVRLAKGTFVEIPNQAWKPGMAASEKFLKIPMKDAGNLLKFIGTATAMGGALGVPMVGWVINEYGAWTGTDPSLTWKKEIEAAMPLGMGRAIGAIFDKGLVGEYLGYDMSELGNLMLPTTKDGFLASITPAAFSIIGTSMRDAYHAASGDAKPMQSEWIRGMKAISPNAYAHLWDAGQLAANQGRYYDTQGQLIGQANLGEVVKLALAGMAPLRDEDRRKAQVDANVVAKEHERLKNAGEKLARKITNHEGLTTAEYVGLMTTPGLHERVQAGLRRANIPTYAKIWKSIAGDKDPEVAAERMRYFQAYWQDALERQKHTDAEAPE